MITKLKWKNHSILGNLELDFTNASGIPYNTIILAGENGTGKTTILETLATFLNLGTIKPFEYIEYKIDNDIFHIYPKTEKDSDFGFHHRKKLTDGTESYIHSNKNNSPNSISSDMLDIRHYGFAYSKARSGFKTNKIQSTTTQQLDQSKYDNDETDDFTSIKQLLVDIDEQDNSAWMKTSRTHPETTIAEFDTSSKMSRFKKAFNNFFDKLQFQEIDNSSPDEKKIIFTKNGNNVEIDNLSTGEKQIVFRGTQLLKNANNMNNSIILIDEPELSMHPLWQVKILEYYRNLFNQNNIQSSQLIIATHSEYVLKSALKDSNNVLVITLNEADGVITPNKVTTPSVLPTITAAETNYIAFDIASIDYHIELYGYLQTKENKHTIKDCDDFILNHSLYDQQQYYKPYSYGKTNYNTLPTYIRNAIDHPDSSHTYTDDELRKSIKFLIQLLK